jgi:uncharacterized membrane protein
MRKLLICLTSVMAICGLAGTAHAQQPKTIPWPQEGIRNFEVKAELTADRKLKITEFIDYDFGPTPKHGIFRNIPETYIRDGMTYDYKYQVGRVLRDGQPETYQQYREGKSLVLKIGKADVTMPGKHVYTIEYETSQAINFFKDGHSELYWNVTGNEWQIGIEKSSFFLKSPLGQATSTLQFTCFTGELGSTESACRMKPVDGGYLVEATRVFNPQEGMTVVFGFPQGTIRPESTGEAAMRILRDNWYLIFPILALFGMLYVWATRGKDPPPETIIPQYESPRGMSPLVLSATLGNGAIPSRGITATIIEMARKGYLHIKYEKTKVLFVESTSYKFLKRQEPLATGPAWEKIIWDGLFKSGTREETSVSDLQADKFYSVVQKASAKATRELETLRIFASNPYLVRGLYITAAVIVFLVVRVAGGDAPASGVVAFITAVIVAVFGWFMPKRTKEGTSIVAEVKGFKWFLSVTEEERLKFHNAPARTPEQFMELLPAAIALEVEKEWAKQFEDLQMAPPDWAEGDMHALSTLALASAISDMHSKTSSSAYSPPSSAGSGGSGFSGGGSGGGGGGGGGGSW